MRILVYTSALASGDDDDRYRAQAAAYSNFHPVNRIIVNGDDLPSTGLRGEVSYYLPRDNQEHDRQEQSPIRKSHNSTAFGQSTSRANLQGPPASVQSDVLNQQQPMASRFIKPMTPIIERKIPASTLISSNPIQHLEQIQSHWRAKIRESEATNFQKGSPFVPDSARLLSKNSKVFIEDTQLAVTALQSQLVNDPSKSISQSSSLESRPVKRRRVSPERPPQRSSRHLDQSLASHQSGPPGSQRPPSSHHQKSSSQLPSQYQLSTSNEGPGSGSRKMKNPSQSGSSSQDQVSPETQRRRTISSQQQQPVGHEQISIQRKSNDDMSPHTSTQIYVHESASQTREDLNKYQEQVQSYQDFESINRMGVFPVTRINSSSLADELHPQQSPPRAASSPKDLPPEADGDELPPNATGQQAEAALIAAAPAHKIADTDMLKLPIDILCPEPEVGFAKEQQSTITPFATQLINNPDVHPRFNPTTYTIPPTFARGRWTINTHNWPLRIQHGFHTTMTTWINLHFFPSVNIFRCCDLNKGEGERYNRLSQVKVYCFAEVLKHVWCAMFLASEGWIKKTGGVTWLDSWDREWVRMPGPKKSKQSSWRGSSVCLHNEDARLA